MHRHVTDMYSKEDILDRIWQNPDAATGLHFQQYRNKWQSSQRMNGEQTARADKLVLERNSAGQVFFHYHGDGEYKPNGDIFELLQYRYNANDFADVLAQAAEAYGIQPTFTGEGADKQREAWKRRASIRNIATEAAGILTAALHEDKGAEARAYIESRGLKPTTHFGAFSDDLRQELTDKLLKKYDAEDVRAAIASLFGVRKKDYSKAAAGEYVDFADAYKVIMPYYNGGRLHGFCMRMTADVAPTYTNEAGNIVAMPKYLFSYGKDSGGIMEKCGYCPEGLDARNEVYLVEGLLDAEAIMQAGYNNVMALGQKSCTDSQIQALLHYGIKNIVYVPDIEHNEDGTLKTEATAGTIKAIQPYLTAGIGGKGFVSLKIASAEEIAAHYPDVKDAADIYKLHGEDVLWQCIGTGRRYWWEWQTEQNMRQNAGNMLEAADNFARLYNSIQSPLERQLIRNTLTKAPIDSPIQKLKDAGITAESLLQIERTGELKTYRSRITEAINALKTAADSNADEVALRRLLDNAFAVQNHSTGQSFMAQVFADTNLLGAQIAQEGEDMETKWTLWNDAGNPVRKISFAPAHVSVFAAPSSHGKTLIMLQTAMYFARTRNEHVLYIGVENDAKQLYTRALCAFIDKEWEGLRVPNRRKAIRKYYKQQPIIEGDTTDVWEAQKAQKTNDDVYNMLRRKIQEYDNIMRPFLHFVRVGNDCEALCDNIRMIVNHWNNAGEPVAAVFIDYIQLLHLTGRNYSRTDEMKNICDRLNELAIEIGLPVIVGSQMNRNATKGESGSTPSIELVDLYNMGESSGIENITEDCYFVWDVDRTRLTKYQKEGSIISHATMQTRSKRIFEDTGGIEPSLRKGRLYVESLKGRENATGCYCLIPTDFATGTMEMNKETEK